MDSKRTDWHGIDVSIDECMYEYGFVMRYDPENKGYRVLYRTPDGRWVTSWFDYDGWIADLKEGDFPDLHGIAKMCGMEPDEYLECVDESGLCSDLLMYYGADDILGTAYEIGMTEEEARKMVDRPVAA